MSRVGSIGIDVGGSKTLFALLDSNMEVIEEIKIKTQGNDEKKFTDNLLE